MAIGARSGSRSRVVATAAAMVLVGAAGAVSASAPAYAGGHGHDQGNNTPAKLTRAVTLPGLLRHLGAFQYIADSNGGNRASGNPGHARSVDYVAWTMKLAGYQVTRQPFEFNFCDERESSFARGGTTYVVDTDYRVMSCSGSGNVTGAELIGVDLLLTEPRDAASSGCEASDFTAEVAGKVALLQRGACAFGVKVANAEAAGAVGAVVMNQGNGTREADPDRYELFGGNLGEPVGIPAVSVSFDLGVQLAGGTGAVSLAADTTAEVRSTENVIAETPGGDPDNVVMVGSHLDAEPDTVGINDNGSGSAALLEIAWQLRKVNPTNKVRFAWWGAEEAGLVGSTEYVGSLSAEDQARVTLYLNFDMIASPNYMLGVYDGDDSAAEGSGPGPEGSAQIEALFQDFFAGRGAPTKAADFSGRSDYGPFIGVGIPAGGLFTGAEVPKTADDVAKWGGVEGAQYDPCYHDPCDSFRPVEQGADADLYKELDRQYPLIGNINLRAFDINADAVATAVVTYAFDTSSIPARAPAPVSARSARAAADSAA